MSAKQLEYELKPVSFKDRVRCSDLAKQSMYLDKDGKPNLSSVVVTTKDAFNASVEWCRAGLKSIEGVEITPENFESELNQLSNADIDSIGLKILMEATSKKKQ